MPWQVWALAAYGAFNLALLIVTIPLDGGPDWALWQALPQAIAEGRMYDTGTEAPMVWSPVMGYVMAAASYLYWPWFALHVGAVLLLRDWRLTLVVGLTAGAWIDALMGNTFVFVFVAGVLAYRGSRPAALIFLLLTLLMPRPLQMPLAAWLLYRDRSLWVPFAAMFTVHLGVVLWSGYLLDWITNATAHMANGNVGPTAIFGRAWLIVGLPLGVWLTVKGRVGWAGVAVSPYLLGVYWLWPFLEIAPKSSADRQQPHHLRRG
jgi:hypothetical protein